jgi:hypothetical protein
MAVAHNKKYNKYIVGNVISLSFRACCGGCDCVVCVTKPNTVYRLYSFTNTVGDCKRNTNSVQPNQSASVLLMVLFSLPLGYWGVNMSDVCSF